MSYLKGVLQSLEWVKIRALENFFSMKIFQKREEEMKQIIRNIAALAVMGICDWILPNLVHLFIILGFSKFNFLDAMSFGTFSGLL